MRQIIRKRDKYLREKTDATMTAKKMLDFKNEQKRLLKVRPYLAEEVKKHGADGDFSENAAYQIAKGKIRGLNRRLDEIEDLLKRADIIEPIKNTDFIQIGNTVTIETNNKEKTYQILGASETNPKKGIISKDSPIGQALLKKRVGETTQIKINNKIISYKITKIN